MTANLSCNNLSLKYGDVSVLDTVSLDLQIGKITSIVGPNGCGKSSLLRCLSRLEKPSQGEVLLHGHDIRRKNTREVARQLAFLPQNTSAPSGMRVVELVIRGRTPHQNPLRQWSAQDQELVERALDQVGLSERANDLLEDLSGGQLQRAWIAMVLAQDTDILILDEPTTYLDLAHQRETLELVKQLQQDRQMTVVMVLHDINLAARYSDYIVAIKDRKILTEGTPKNIITVDTISEIYGLDCSVIDDPHTGLPHVIMK